ncbi:P-loop containing nucleoside triphosphate hydrolase protein [Mycena galopus ATCC 62051]|nr:P-loop containing nucleoside triphosphate hydrolase protein [Mycena galopus ATCC 62051]
MDFTPVQAVMVLVHLPDNSQQKFFWIPAFAIAISAFILLLHLVLARIGIQTKKVSPSEISERTILWFRVARLLGCIGLLVLSIPFKGGLLRSIPYLYSLVLALLSVNPKNARHRLIRHANYILLLVFCVYVYRDLVPLATFTGVPADLDEGWRLWTKIALLFITAVIIPMFTPRQYIPVDPLNPQAVINPEQTASAFSFAFYFFLDHIIFLGYRESQLQESELPLAMNKLLRYIETRDTLDVVVRPWVWIIVILLGPVVGSLSQQRYIFIGTRCLVQAEAIITQLVFSHSLRIRMKSETTAATSGDDSESIEGLPSTARASSDAANADETITPESNSATAQTSSSSVAAKAPFKPAKEEAKKSEGSLVGKINNLVTVDLANIGGGRDFLMLVVLTPLQLTLGTWFLYTLLGWSVWVGVASMILLAPVPGYMAKLVQSIQKERMKRTDERVQSVSEAMNILRMVKLFGWEPKIHARIEDKVDLATGLVNFLVPVSCETDPSLPDKQTELLLVFTLIMRQPLNASKVFSSMTVFDLLRDNIREFTYWLNYAITAKVSLDRVDDFLENASNIEFSNRDPYSPFMQTELLDAFDEKETPALFAADSTSDERIGFRDTTFSWSKESNGPLSQFQLKIEGELIFSRGRINLVAGPTGSGKTSLLMALLGEMHFIPSSPDSWYNLPRNSGVAYAAQESWVLNETIRSNIVFDTPFDEERYQKVLYQCALEPDLDLFEAGDQTEVGEKGLTLSGGQKARLTLARAVYSKASILLLDDVLAALEKVSNAHTAQWIVNKCLRGDLIGIESNGHPRRDFGSDGRIQSQGTISEIIKRSSLGAQLQKDQQALDKIQPEVDAVDSVAKPAEGKLIVAEEIQLGHVSASAFKMYLLSMAGKYPFFFFAFFFGALFLQHSLLVLSTWQLGHWGKQYDQRPAQDVDIAFYLSVFVAIVLSSNIASATAFTYLVFRQLRASKVIHINLISSVLSAPLRWLDVTPTSRIIARVTNDVRVVDDTLAVQFYPVTFMVVSMIVKFVAVLIYAPIFFLPGVVVGAVGAWIGQIYMSGQLPVKRLMSNTRAPVLAHFGAAIAGLVSIRAFGAESKFSAESLVRIDRYTRAARNYYNLNLWIAVRIDFLGAMFSASLATYLVYIKNTSAGDSGFLLNMAITFTSMLLWVVRYINDIEVQGNSLERIQAYINIGHEKPATEAGKPPAYWPASGDLRVEGLSARYSEDGPKVLHDISFHIKAGERVGVVGRTGSGKSSLTLSLLRCIPTEGSMKYDGLETSELNLDALRSSITIIPQVPELLSGSLRENLDPFGQYDDEELNYALRAAGFFALQNEMDEGRITLDSAVSTGGTNLSVGQRQIFALARAIVRKSKILILDEATSAIDYKTDSIIQNSLRQELSGDVSLITVAHRLQTVMDADKIMVLDAGRIVEFDSPQELLKVEDGKLRALLDQSADRDALYLV